MKKWVTCVRVTIDSRPLNIISANKPTSLYSGSDIQLYSADASPNTGSTRNFFVSFCPSNHITWISKRLVRKSFIANSFQVLINSIVEKQ